MSTAIRRHWRRATSRIKVENPKGVSGAIAIQAKGALDDVFVVTG